MTVVDFFFSTISNFWGQVLRKIILDRPEGSGRASAAFWGRPGGVREGILGAPGESGGHLGRVLGRLGVILERLFFQSDFGSILCSILIAKRVAKGRLLGRQNGEKIDPKTRLKFKSEKIASWKQLGPILSRF